MLDKWWNVCNEITIKGFLKPWLWRAHPVWADGRTLCVYLETGKVPAVNYSFPDIPDTSLSHLGAVRIPSQIPLSPFQPPQAPCSGGEKVLHNGFSVSRGIWELGTRCSLVLSCTSGLGIHSTLSCNKSDLSLLEKVLIETWGEVKSSTKLHEITPMAMFKKWIRMQYLYFFPYFNHFPACGRFWQ